MKCRSCRSETTQFLDLGSTPLADKFETVQPFYPLGAAYCSHCWLVQLTHDVPDEILFGEDYGFFSGSSPALVTHFAEYAASVMHRYPIQCEQGILEIACNDGTLLRNFQLAGYPSVGIDPALPPTEAARAQGLNVITAPFTSTPLSSAKDPQFGVIIANNVLAHVTDPSAFMQAVSTLLASDGVFIAEFQYLGDLVAGNQWDLFYHEHRSFLSLTAVDNLAKQHGLSIHHWATVDTQGGSVRVEIKRITSTPEQLTFPHESWLTAQSTFDAMQGRVDYSVFKLQQATRRFSTLAGFAAAAKATTLIHYADLNLEYVVDLSPSKIGKFMPGTSIPIVADTSALIDGVVLLARNYLPRFIRDQALYISQGGKTIIPLPLAEVI